MNTPEPNWFTTGGDDYARFRPQYPFGLIQELAALPARHRLAVDVGCGNGQLTNLLAEHFDVVIGVDPSAEQLAHALAGNRVQYVSGQAEQLPVEDRSADLVAAAQAAHWFDLPRFYEQVRRVAAPGAVIVLLAYGEPILHPDQLNRRLVRFARKQIGGYWPPEISHVYRAYRSLDFPFAPIDISPVDIELQLDLHQLLGYLGTWSAVRAAAAAGQEHLLTDFAAELGALWQDPDTPRPVRMPVYLRVGHIGRAAAS